MYNVVLAKPSITRNAGRTALPEHAQAAAGSLAAGFGKRQGVKVRLELAFVSCYGYHPCSIAVYKHKDCHAESC